jgi:hypothetical protein
MRVSTRVLLFGSAATLFSALPSQAQSFAQGASQIPSGNPANNTSTENLDIAHVDHDGD